MKLTFPALMCYLYLTLDLNQKGILHLFQSNDTTKKSRNLQNSEDGDGKWKCKPRKRPLLKTVEKMLCLPLPVVSQRMSRTRLQNLKSVIPIYLLDQF